MMNFISNWEIIPNWHPVFVHFTIGLLSISALLYLIGLVIKKPNLLMVARWNLWIGAGITIGTVWAGFYAYDTVAHDGPSHIAMINHKNWALVTVSLFGVLALWSLIKHRGAKTVHPAFVGLILLASGLLAVTGFKGGEVVYRHGTGVMRMPEIAGDGGHGSHAHDEDVGADHHDRAKAEPHGNLDHHGTKAENPAIVEKEHDHGAHAH